MFLAVAAGEGAVFAVGWGRYPICKPNVRMIMYASRSYGLCFCWQDDV